MHPGLEEKWDLQAWREMFHNLGVCLIEWIREVA